MIFSYLLNMQSHPSWVCGLKLKGSYYLLPTVRFDVSRAYGEKSIWFFFLGAFVLIDIFKIKD